MPGSISTKKTVRKEHKTERTANYGPYAKISIDAPDIYPTIIVSNDYMLANAAGYNSPPLS